MSVFNRVTQAIGRFLASSDPEVLCISGDWGVGKTFTWKCALRERIDAGSLRWKRYSYVSLFGVGSLDALKQAIFENIEFFTRDDVSFEEEAKNFGGSAFGWINKHRGIVSALPFLGPAAEKAIAGAAPLVFSSVRDQLICIDDLERRGDGLKLKDVLGLVSYLKEQRNCSIVVLLNDKELGGEESDFRIQFEKVVDSAFVFKPTSEESLKVALRGEEETTKLMAYYFAILKISNIRVIKKIERLVRSIVDELGPQNEGVVKQAVQTLTLLGWAQLQPSMAPTRKYILETRGRGAFSTAMKEVSPEESAWAELLDMYGFAGADEFDLVLAQGVEAGLFDGERLRAAATTLSEQLELTGKRNALSEAWELFRSSFEDNAQSIIDAMENALLAGPSAVTPMNLDGAFKLLKKIGGETKATTALTVYMSMFETDEGSLDADEHALFFEEPDPAVRAAFEKRLRDLEQPSDPKCIILKIGRHGDYGKRDVERISRLSDEEVEHLFKATIGKDLRVIVKGALSFTRLNDQTSDMKRFTETVERVLAKIAGENSLNAERVANLRMLALR